MAIANRLARSIYKVLAGDQYKELGYLRGDPQEQQIKRLVNQLRHLGVQIYHHSHQKITSKSKLIVDDTGVIQIPVV